MKASPHKWDCCPYESGPPGLPEPSTWGHSKKMVINELRSRPSLNIEADRPAPWSWPSSLHSSEKPICCLSLWYFVTAAQTKTGTLTYSIPHDAHVLGYIFHPFQPPLSVWMLFIDCGWYVLGFALTNMQLIQPLNSSLVLKRRLSSRIFVSFKRFQFSIISPIFYNRVIVVISNLTSGNLKVWITCWLTSIEPQT